MNVINLTPHPIIVQCDDGSRVTYPASGTVARVSSTPSALETVLGLPIPVAGRALYGEITGLPAPYPGTVYVVSAMVLAHCQDRDDVVGPGTGPNDGAIRDESGRIVAVTRFVRG